MILKRIYNQTAVTQSIAWKGVQLSIKPYEEQLVDEDVAEAFLDRCQDFVVPAAEEFATVATTDNKPTTKWLANMTGNPDGPEKIELRVWKDKQWQWVMSENPIKRAHNLKEWANGPMVEYTTKSGVLEALNMPGHFVSLPAFQRVEFDQGTADWFMERSLMSSPSSRSGNFPKICESRKPSNFEPDMSWDLNTMLAYLKFVDPDCKLPRDEQHFIRQYRKKTPEEFKQLINEEKRACMKKLYFRLVDPSYRLPSRKEFEEFLKGPGAFVEEPTQEASEDALLDAALKPDAAPSVA